MQEHKIGKLPLIEKENWSAYIPTPMSAASSKMRRFHGLPILGDRTLVKKLGLTPERKQPLTAGGLDGMLCKYELY